MKLIFEAWKRFLTESSRHPGTGRTNVQRFTKDIEDFRKGLVEIIGGHEVKYFRKWLEGEFVEKDKVRSPEPHKQRAEYHLANSIVMKILLDDIDKILRHEKIVNVNSIVSDLQYMKSILIDELREDTGFPPGQRRNRLTRGQLNKMVDEILRQANVPNPERIDDPSALTKQRLPTNWSPDALKALNRKLKDGSYK